MKYNYSVILPYYDKYDLFIKAVESVPDRKDIQIIIVDNSPESLSYDQLPKKGYATVCYTTSSKTKGAGCARNVGLQLVEGFYILFLDADDYFSSEAFSAFDRYLNREFDIVYFKPLGIRLTDGSISKRHNLYVDLLESYLNTNDDSRLRYKWLVPWGKLFNSEFVLSGGYLFDEVKVSNDVWFSIITGHNAKKVHGDSSVVYVVTEGETGSSLTKKLTKENWFIRFQEQVKINKYLKSVNKYKYRIRLLGAIRIALREFGFKEFFHFLKYALVNRVGIL